MILQVAARKAGAARVKAKRGTVELRGTKLHRPQPRPQADHLGA